MYILLSLLVSYIAVSKPDSSKIWFLCSLILYSTQFKVHEDLKLHFLGNCVQQNHLERYDKGIFLKIALDYSYVALFVVVTGSHS